MQLGIFAKTFSAQGALPVFKAVRAAGYQTAQFNMACLSLPSMPDVITAETCADIASASTASGVKLAAVSGTYNMGHPDPAVRAEGLRRLGVMIAAARDMGTTLVTLCTGTRDTEDQWRHHPDNATAEAWRCMAHEMAKALDLATRHGVDLGIEPELANIVSTPQLALRLIAEMKSPRLRVVLDPANLFEQADTATVRKLVEEATTITAPHLAMAHAKDRAADGKVVAAGKGIIDFHHFAQCLRKARFTGPLITHGLSEAEAPAVAHFLKEQLPT